MVCITPSITGGDRLLSRLAESASVASSPRGIAAGAAVASCADVLGVVCFLAWARVVLYSQTAFDIVIYNNCIAVLATAVVSIVAVALFPKPELLARKGAVAAVSACAVLAGVVMAFADGEAVCLAAVCVQQVCMALLLAPLALVVCRGSRKRLVWSVVIGVAFSLACILICRIFPGAIRCMTTVFPFATGLLLCVALDASRKSDAGREQRASGVEAPDAGGLSEASLKSATGARLAASVRTADPQMISVTACAIIAQFFYGAVFQPYVINASVITFGACVAGIAIAAGIGALLVKYGSLAQGVAAISMLFVTVVSLTLFALGIFESPIVSIAIVGAVSCCLSLFGWLFAYDSVVCDGRAPVPAFALFHFILGGSLGMYCGIVFHGATGSNYGMMAMVAIVGIALFTLLYIVMDRMHSPDAAAKQKGAVAVAALPEAGADLPSAEMGGEIAAPAESGAGPIRDATLVGGADEASDRVASGRPEDVLMGVYGQRMAEMDFTDREMEVCVKLLSGMSIHAVAEELQCSDNTVKYHLRNVYHKCDVHSRDELRAFLQMPVSVE